MWDLSDYCLKKTVPTYEMIEDIKIIHPGTHLASSIHKKKDKSSSIICFLTVGERGIVRIWSSERYLVFFAF